MSTPTPRGINESDVWKAADALLLDGARPTIERVRQKIGRGSPNTVTPHLETWFRSLGARIADPMAFSSPPALPDPISEAAKHFWEAAMASARGEAASALAADREALSTAVRKLDEERAEIGNQMAGVNIQLLAKEEAAEVLRAHLAESQDRITALLAETKAKDHVIDELRTETARMEADHLRFRQQFDDDRSAFERSRQELDARESANAARWAMEVDRAREAVKIAQSRVIQTEKEQSSKLETLNSRVVDLQTKLRQGNELQAKMESEMQALRHAHEAESNAAAAQRNLYKERESELLRRSEHLEAQLSKVIEQLTIKENEHGSILRLLIDKRGPEVPVEVATPKRRRKSKG